MQPTSAAKSLRNAYTLMGKDLAAIPDDAFDRCFGGKARTVADIVHEANLVNDHVALVMREETPFDWPDGTILAPEGQRTKAAVMEAFRVSSESVMATADAFSQEEIDAPLVTDEGTTTRAERCRFMTLHLWYHSGQLNFIQTLLGDDGWHW